MYFRKLKMKRQVELCIFKFFYVWVLSPWQQPLDHNGGNACSTLGGGGGGKETIRPIYTKSCRSEIRNFIKINLNMGDAACI